MWRQQSVHTKGDTEFLADAIIRVQGDASLITLADATLDEASASEPLLAQAFKTPQSPPHHSEGPFVHDHLQLLLTVLYAITEERLHLIDIEEFRAMKGYEGEIDEMEEMIKENIGLFETFALCHDAAKWACVKFEAPAGSRGEALGFTVSLSDHWSESAHVENTAARTKYLDLYESFAHGHRQESPREVFLLFYETYKIRCKFPGHARAVHTSAYRDLLRRVGAARRLPDRDLELLEDLIGLHLEPITDFASKVAPSRIGRYVRVAASRGYDADDFLDLLQACVFLDLTCASKRMDGRGGLWHEFDVTRNFLKSEHDYAPQKRVQKLTVREERLKARERAWLREVGLDGVSLMDLLGMESGPAFGQALASIQEAVHFGGALPRFGGVKDDELRARAEKFSTMAGHL